MTPETATAAVNAMDIRLVFTIIGTGIATVGLIYTIIRNFRQDFKASLGKQDQRMLTALNAQDERIFQLATGKTLKEAMLEAKRKAEGQ